VLTFDEIKSVDIVSEWNLSKLSKLKIRGISTDSRKLRRGDIFFAIEGERFDGHDFVRDAFRRGAIACFVKIDWFRRNRDKFRGKVLIAVDDTIKALGQLANIYRRKFDIPVIAVTGSNGKTTAKEMIADVLSQKYRVLRTRGNLNNQIGVPLTLFRLRKSHQVAVIEVGTNHFGEIRYLCEIAEPDHGVITNIGRAHIEFFGDRFGVAKAKGELFDFLSKRDGFIFVNLDDDMVVNISRKVRRKLTYGFSGGADVEGEFISLDSFARPEFMVRYDGREVRVKLRVPGRHLISHALSAFAVGLKFGIPLSRIKRALTSFRSFPGRMEVIKIKGITIINDSYNANPDSVTAGLKTLSEIRASGKRIAVLGDMFELGGESISAHREVGEMVIECGIDYLFTIGEYMRNAYEVALRKIRHAIHFSDKELLVFHLFEIIGRGDVILVKGSRGMRMEEVVDMLIKKLR
jgi:UDP-N-acetylmuramoyl-tripeptide--D-alanyl-D-alanine ligase